LAIKYHYKADSSFQNIDTCLKYTTLAIPLLKKIGDWDKYQYDLNCLSYCYQHLEQYDKMLDNNIFALSEASKRFDKTHVHFKTALNNLGVAYRINGSYQEAIDAYNAALVGSDELQLDEGNFTGTIYENLGVIHLEKGDFDLAISYFKRSLVELRQYFEMKMSDTYRTYPREAKVHQFLSEAYRKTQEYQNSKDHLYTALEIYKKNQNTPPSYIYYGLLELFDLSIITNEELEAREILEEIEMYDDISDRQMAQAKFRNAQLLLRNNEFVRAVTALELAKEKSNSLSIGDMTDIYLLLIDVHFLEGNVNKAEVVYNDIYKQLETKDSRMHSLELFEINLKYLERLKENFQDFYFDNYEEALKRHFSLSRFALNEIISNKDRNVLLERIKSYNESALKFLYENRLASYSSRLQILAFDLIENSKSLLLQNEFIRRNYFEELDMASKSLDNHNEIERKLFQFENAYKKANWKKDKGYKSEFIKQRNEKQLLNLSDSLFYYKRLKVLNLDSISKFLPKSYQNAYAGNIEFGDLKLTNEEEFYNFLEGSKDVYCVKVSSKDVSFVSIQKDAEFIQNIKSLETYNRFNSTTEIENYTNASSFLINELFGSLDLNVKDKVVSPDGIISQIAFEGLVSNNKPLRFLVEDFNILYTFSASIFQLQRDQKLEINSSFVFAPVFENSELYLPFSTIEYDDEIIKHEEKCFANCATVYNLLNSFTNTDLIHISTHAQSEWNNSIFEPEILCYDSTIILSDLMSKKIVSKLVVLSACETSKGEVLIGEGQSSFNRVFTAIGVPAVVSTLWKVNDYSQALVMNLFYNNLSENISGYKALSLAKRQYLKQASDINRSPYFWAGTIFTGSPNVIYVNSKSKITSTIIIIFITVLIMLLFFFYIRLNKTK